MPAYAKFLKDIISHKRKWKDHETIPINEECSAVIQNKQQRTKNGKYFGKFLKAFQQLKLNIPILNMINIMPAYTKFLKDIISHKRKWEDHETIPINEECSAVIQNMIGMVSLPM